jgi:hypothetical protein
MAGRIRSFRRAARTLGVFGVTFLLAGSGLLIGTPGVGALPLPDRSLHIGDSAPAALTTHDFTFSYATTSDPVGSVVFEYCTSPLPQLACVAPNGLDLSTALLTAQNGETGYTVFSATASQVVLTRVASPPTVTPSSYSFTGVVNPSDLGTFFVRISTYDSPDGSGSPIDFGAVVNATTQGVQISTEVPPILKFCVGLSLGDDCSTADESVVDLGELSATSAASGTSQMIAATNAQFGLAIAVYGTTMTSGNNVIEALATPTVSAPGNAQFGLNLRDNSNPNIGQEPSGSGLVTVASSYSIPNRYVFISGSTVATSPAATDTRKLTASYIVNTPPAQPAGVYTATMTYICTATF